ncbi:teneurin-m [Lepeophtheirus salmonis]|uniref:teneurin-m n=1 Tax=Lepeophtheirus salmonis TaxID=72036 RepID=UPI001AEB0A79|nr:teneurin-4-like [Lepeophtheirus salmonis]XP_040569425.1 teneurin-4-like [Lepeophtheirus salmonis]
MWCTGRMLLMIFLLNKLIVCVGSSGPLEGKDNILGESTTTSTTTILSINSTISSQDTTILPEIVEIIGLDSNQTLEDLLYSTVTNNSSDILTELTTTQTITSTTYHSTVETTFTTPEIESTNQFVFLEGSGVQEDISYEDTYDSMGVVNDSVLSLDPVTNETLSLNKTEEDKSSSIGSFIDFFINKVKQFVHNDTQSYHDETMDYSLDYPDESHESLFNITAHVTPSSSSSSITNEGSSHIVPNEITSSILFTEESTTATGFKKESTTSTVFREESTLPSFMPTAAYFQSTPLGVDSLEITPSPSTKSPEFRFVFPAEDEETTLSFRSEESVLVNEAGVPTLCISYVDTLRNTFVRQINELLTNTSASCIEYSKKPSKEEEPCTCQTPTTSTTTTTTSSTTTTTIEATTTTSTTTTSTTKLEEVIHSIAENSSLNILLECHESYGAQLVNLNYEIQVISSSSLLILNQFGRLPTLKSHEDIRLSTSNITTIRDLSNGTFFKMICLCETDEFGCEADLFAFEMEIKKVSYLSDAPLIVEEPFPQLLITTPVMLCDDRCYIHGTCSNGTCVCNHGWNGKHCTLPGCQNNCGHGECIQSYEMWKCLCQEGWEGSFCEHPLELNCSDKIDNDEDGLIDCQDPECCVSDPICSLSQLCLTVDDPENILSKNESISTFFDGILPLLDRNTGIQRYARIKNFNPSRISVIRGRIVTKKTGSGLPGVRISRENSLGEGFTLSRKDGHFDFVTNGGNLAVLKFGKSPFPFVSRRVYIPSHQILDIGSIILDADDDWSLTMSPQQTIKYCPDHIYGNLSVVGIKTPTKSSNSLLLGIEGSVNLKLVYKSESNATHIKINLIKGKPPSSLVKIHLEIRIGGRFYTRFLEPEDDLNVDFIWDRRDVYGRRVFGKSLAFIRAGYEYSNCIHSPVWSSKTLNNIQAMNIPKGMSGINQGWNLNIHHRLDPISKILFKGDGSVLDLERSRFHTRLQEFVTSDKGNKPIGVLINSRDGSIIIGFSSEINLYDPFTKKFQTLLRLNASSEESRYYMALNPMNDDIYVSLPSEKIVLRIKDTEEVLDEFQNYELIAGNRKKCRSVHHCGNGGHANESSLIYPKGIDIASDGTIYLADGRSLRRINNGIINSISGSEDSKIYEWRPPFSECDVNWQTRDLDLRWPTDLALNPLDENTLIYVDDGDVFEYIIDSSVARPLFAAPTWCSDVSKRSLKYLEEDVTSVEYDQKGNLHLVVNRLINSHSSEKSGIMTLDSENRLISTLPVGEKFDIPSYDFDFISDLSVANDGSYIICDFQNERVHRLSYGELILNFENKYDISFPKNNEIYSFSPEGIHLETRALFTDSPLISFLYDNYNNIIGVTNLYKSTLEIERDYEDARRPVRRINIDGKLSHDIKLSSNSEIKSIRFPSGNILSFGYQNGTLIWKLENGKLRTIYEYDSLGFYLKSIYPDGTSNHDGRHFENNHNVIEIEYEIQSLPGRSSNKMRDVVLPHSFQMEDLNLEWNHYVRASSRSFDAFNGIGKHFMVNGKRSFSLEMHPRSGIQSVYDGGSISKRLLRVEEFYVPPRRLWIPEIDTGLSVVDETFTRDRMLSSVKRDDTFVHFIYDESGRIISLNSSGKIEEFFYDSINDAFPSTVITANGAEYSIFRDGSGGLSSVVTPSNYTFNFHLIPMIGYYLMTYKPPWKSVPFRKKFLRHDEQSTEAHGRVSPFSNIELEESYRYDESTGRIVEDDIFFYDYGVTSAVIQKTDSTFYGIYESDSLGRETARLMINDGRPIYKESCIYNKDTISFRSYSLGNDDSPAKVIKYSFDTLGLLIGYEDEAFQWKYYRDAVGNVVNMDFGAGRTRFQIEYGERISKVGEDFDVIYDNNTGYMMSRHEFRFEYDDFGRIESTFKGDQLSSSFYDDWDHMRVTQIYDNGVLITYQYERKDKPLLPTRVVRESPESPTSKTTLRLFYDHLDRLFFCASC